ncbi:MAG TPA: PepSY domain-containing protein [Sphingomonas sp.]|jgi:hypothetical protein|uniref:PepSY domain-containing protein n=1 Tax=Sphingomonas sp. TaxID=28214 RepID=UPI002ED8BBB4
MIKSALLLFAIVSAPVPAAPEPAQHHSDQRRAFEARREGRVLPVREIERRVIPAMGSAQYLGFDFDDGPAVYTLKFLRDGKVIWIEVDGRTGQVLGRTGR